jgi:small conductance mechanosensitive channel
MHVRNFNYTAVLINFLRGQMFSSFKTALDHFWDPNNWLGAAFYAVIFLIAAVIVSRFIRVASTRVILRHEDRLGVDRTVVLFLTQFAQISVYIIGLIIFFHIIPALNRLGSALLTGVSVVSVIFGLAAQNTLSNLVAGCTLLLYRPFHIDDFIQVATPTGTESGIVERLTLGYTMVRTLDDRLVIVPNSLMASQVSLNLNRRSLHSMAIIQIGVVNSGGAGEIRSALYELAEKDKRIRRIISMRTQTLEEGGAIISFRAWCTTSADADSVQKDFLAHITEKFAGKDEVYFAQAA